MALARPLAIRPATRFLARFLGKTNMLPATMKRQAGQTRVTIGDASWITPYAIPDGPVFGRPEKIGFVDQDGRSGTVRTRVFQGTQWRLEVETLAGMITVHAPTLARHPLMKGRGSAELACRRHARRRRMRRAALLRPLLLAGGFSRPDDVAG